ncbi:5'-methylthioadenosine/adenosylhomocysteine nucleosidase [Maribacter sp. Asnod1-A12]|uniref:5'-methylthioadenosine/adenosylhomocysteine nucleosidase n=1 Tax=Maribacter sp. Asnod1-A12 TaxID=3160576 RepID=UPI0038707578
MAIRQYLIFLMLFALCGVKAQRIAIMGAMDAEMKLLKGQLENKEEIEKNGIIFYTGKLKNKEVVLLKAGIGKVNAAYSTAILTTHFKLNALIFTGVAGGLHPDIRPGDIVIADSLVQYDFGQLKDDEFITWPTRNLIENTKNPLFLSVDSTLLYKSKLVSNTIQLKTFKGRAPKFFVGTIATGDTFVSDTMKAKSLYSNFNALATEMEGAAVAQVCTMLNLPYIVIRSCSDNANTDAHTDYHKFVEIAAINSAQLVLAILENEL